MNELQLQVEALKNKFLPNYYKSVDVDEGWYQIVVDCDNLLTEIDPNYQIAQIKQKFGGLRYYFQPSSSEYNDELWTKMNSIVQAYENIAWITCEATGLPGLLMKSPNGYYKTLNPKWTSTSEVYNKYTIVKHSTYMQPNDTMPWEHSDDSDYI